MKQVKDLILYQIATDRNYKVGDKFNFGKTTNYQHFRVFNSNFYEGDLTLAKMGFNYVDSKNKKKDSDLVVKLSKGLAESDFVIRELAVEKVRHEKFPNYPSRFACMFLSDSREEVLKNIKTFYKKGYGTCFQAVAVKLNGKLFTVKEFPMPRGGYSYGEYLNLAEKYWSQNENSQETTKEILFEGEAEIVEILDEFIYKK